MLSVMLCRKKFILWLKNCPFYWPLFDGVKHLLKIAKTMEKFEHKLGLIFIWKI
jgi:hypothetical protein